MLYTVHMPLPTVTDQLTVLRHRGADGKPVHQGVHRGCMCVGLKSRVADPVFVQIWSQGSVIRTKEDFFLFN